jgi:superfamily II DNA or RNA helicase
VSGAKTLREWQVTALDRWIQNGFRGIAEVATAGGKTFFAISGIQEWLKVYPEGKVLILVPTTALQDQWFVNLLDDLKLSPRDINTWPDSTNMDSRFQIMVVNTARTKAMEVVESCKYLLLIADECHRYASQENKSALAIRTTGTLGLTATAERDYDNGLEEILIPTLGPIVYRYSLADARKDGVVSDFEVLNVKVDFTELESAEYKKLSARLAQAYSQGDENKATIIARMRASVSRNAAKRIPAAVAIAQENKGRRIIIFHEEIEKAETLKNLLHQRGHSVGIYHSQLGMDKRRDNLLQFRRGMLEVLVCCRALDEGVDVPESDVAIIAASTSSSRQRIQRIGRVIRVHKDKEIAKVYTLYITEREEEFLRGEEARLSSILKFKWFEMGSK